MYITLDLDDVFDNCVGPSSLSRLHTQWPKLPFTLKIVETAYGKQCLSKDVPHREHARREVSQFHEEWQRLLRTEPLLHVFVKPAVGRHLRKINRGMNHLWSWSLRQVLSDQCPSGSDGTLVMGKKGGGWWEVRSKWSQSPMAKTIFNFISYALETQSANNDSLCVGS